MRYVAASFVFAFVFSLAHGAHAYPTLLQCNFEFMPMEKIFIFNGPKGLTIAEKRPDRDWTHRALPKEEWDAKQIELKPGGNTSGYVYLEGKRWYYIFKSLDSWYSNGTANCW